MVPESILYLVHCDILQLFDLAFVGKDVEVDQLLDVSSINEVIGVKVLEKTGEYLRAVFVEVD